MPRIRIISTIFTIFTYLTVKSTTATTPPTTPPTTPLNVHTSPDASVANYISSILPPSGWTILSFAQTVGGVISPEEQEENAQISGEEVRRGGEGGGGGGGGGIIPGDELKRELGKGGCSFFLTALQLPPLHFSAPLRPRR